eukprot:Em0003g1772a
MATSVEIFVSQTGFIDCQSRSISLSQFGLKRGGPFPFIPTKDKFFFCQTLEGVALDRGHWIHVTLEGVALDSDTFSPQLVHWIHVTLEGVALDRGHWIHVTLGGVALDRGHWIHVTLEGVALDRGHWIHVTLSNTLITHWESPWKSITPVLSLPWILLLRSICFHHKH